MMTWRKWLSACLFLVTLLPAAAQDRELTFDKGRFSKGDNPVWKSVDFDDSGWRTLSVNKTWDAQGVKMGAGYAWYRFRFVLPEKLLQASDLREVLRIAVGRIDDADETYLNGVLVGKTGGMPGDKGGYASRWDKERVYRIPVTDKNIRWGKENVLAVRVYSGNEPGGMYRGPVRFSVPDRVDEMSITFEEGRGVCLRNGSKKAQKGVLTLETIDAESGKVLAERTLKQTVKGQGVVRVPLEYDVHRQVLLRASYQDNATGRSIAGEFVPKYILTPAAPRAPRYNGPRVYGVRPQSPVIFKIPTSGHRPMKFSVDRLPEGLTLDAEQGILAGRVAQRGDYRMVIKATNGFGTMEQEFTLCVGDKIGLTPPMGWNSWNCWGLSVSEEKVMASAAAILDKGLADYGYAYINVDDAWEAPARNADGTIAVNEKFPDMAGLGRWLHNHGLKFGIYSSPGDRTCGGYLGSLGHEKQDAETYNAWGVDYLKYDWCGYSKVFAADADKSVAAYVRPYLLMEKHLRAQPRDIFYSLCQYGMADVWTWGHAVDANSWRTTGDITDTWESLRHIGFERQRELHPYAGPGHWNDPDMLIVGKVGWSNNLRDTRLTPDEQYTHISLWALLAANMLIGCDVAQIDSFTLGLLCNHEVNAVNQDVLGKQAWCVAEEGDLQLWVRPLADNTWAVGLFNLGSARQRVDLSAWLARLGKGRAQRTRDLWRQKDLTDADNSVYIASHGVKFLKVSFP